MGGRAVTRRLLSEVEATVKAGIGRGVGMTVMVQTVDKDELRCRRARLLKRSGLSWPELRKRAEAYSLSDE